MIAKNELAAADYYLKINAYVAAVRRANYVVENIPNSSENLRALKILEISYNELGYTDLLNDIQEIIQINYPNESEISTSSEGWSWNFLNRPKKSSEEQ